MNLLSAHVVNVLVRFLSLLVTTCLRFQVFVRSFDFNNLVVCIFDVSELLSIIIEEDSGVLDINILSFYFKIYMTPCMHGRRLHGTPPVPSITTQSSPKHLERGSTPKSA